MKEYTYLLINLAVILIPLIASFYPKKAFWKDWKFFIPANLIVAILFLIWDALFTKVGIWGFNPDYLTGIYFANLPLEEVLFFFAIPYACVFSYFALKYLVPRNPLRDIHKYLSIILLLVFIVVWVFSINRAYTSLTLGLTIAYLIVGLIMKRDLSYHYLGYFLVLPFFFLSNGLLTGSWLKEPIVWYNDLENLGIRMFTIPVEDVIYGFLLIALNIDLYEWLKKFRSSRSQ